ncbi:IclR family transcriptional regulator domain-containing protein [Sphaerotilus mobilis]|uniref:IclR family transcriptional regulator n=1 Tax=Sphaerotilus mobilis TaxID=47994 RepID=A0A4Q7LE85_9BURK|nr:IclR family transcriptional regulator C-terminal domain-containing protein [Sphaerotilus mobilis]RZS52302.1 IclR family transcriptional regulator [Sphaerotilus mobilis]
MVSPSPERPPGATAHPAPALSEAAEFAVDGNLPIDPADLIAGLGRGLRVIECFDDEHARLTAAQVHQRTGIPRTAARRHLLSLCHFGYAATDGKHFWLTPRVLRLGQSYLESARLPRLVQPFLQRLSAATGETVNVSVLDGHSVVYVARSNTPRVVSIGFHAGARVPAHVVSTSRVLLATLSDADLQKWVAAHEFAGFTASTVVTAQDFVEQVMQARRQDHWISVGQLDVGLTGVATALRDRHGECKGALSMTLQSAAWPPEQVIARLVPALLETAQTLRPVV